MVANHDKTNNNMVTVYKILLGIGFLCLIGKGITDIEWFTYGAVIFLLAGLTTLVVSGQKENKKG